MGSRTSTSERCTIAAFLLGIKNYIFNKKSEDHKTKPKLWESRAGLEGKGLSLATGGGDPKLLADSRAGRKRHRAMSHGGFPTDNEGMAQEDREMFSA